MYLPNNWAGTNHHRFCAYRFVASRGSMVVPAAELYVLDSYVNYLMNSIS
jgi:hypothetical protein